MNRVDSCNLHERQSIEFAFFWTWSSWWLSFLQCGLLDSVIPRTGVADGFPGAAAWLGSWRRPVGVRCLTRQLTRTRGRLRPDSAADGDQRASAAWLGNRRRPEGVSCLTRQQTGTRGRRLPDSATDGDPWASAAWAWSIKTAIVGLWWFLVKTFVQQP